MANLSKQALRIEIWAMLPGEVKKDARMKRTYLNSMMADAESYANGKVLEIIKDRWGATGIESVEQSGTKLKVEFKKASQCFLIHGTTLSTSLKKKMQPINNTNQ